MYNSENKDNNNLNQNFMQQSFNNQGNFGLNNNINNNKNKNMFIVIGIIAVVIIVAFMFFGKDKSSNNTTQVQTGETLAVYELNGRYNFDFQVIDIEKNHAVSSPMIYTGDCYALKVKIKNNSNSDLDLHSLIEFSLLDSADQEIDHSNLIITSNFEGSIKLNIPAGSTEIGYIYFYHFDEAGNDSNIDTSRVDKLKMSVIKDIYKEDGTTKGNYSNYYISLK